MFQSIEGGPAAHTVSLINPALDDQLPLRLREHVQRLKRIIPVISISILALRMQNSELDEDIASVLQLHAGGPLDEEVEDLEALMESLASQRAGKGKAA